jgi:hypothetical protein
MNFFYPFISMKQGLRSGRLPIVVSISIFSILFSGFIGQWSLDDQVVQFVKNSLPPVIESGLRNNVNSPASQKQLLLNINRDLSTISISQPLGFINQMTLELKSLNATPPLLSAGEHLSQWQEADQTRYVVYRTHTIWNLGLLIGESIMAGLVIAFFCGAFPKPMGRVRQQWISWLRERGHDLTDATTLTQNLHDAIPSSQQQWLLRLVDGVSFSDALMLSNVAHVRALSIDLAPWLIAGWKQTSCPDRACTVALAPSELQFDVANQTLDIHGLRIEMGQTPLFYYLWYNLQRRDTDGWVLNPSSRSPDLASARELMALMAQYQGHPKAIGELENQGLRAKTLDQNRSKIKDALISQLGEALAEDFLFESMKDQRTGRSHYRIVSRCPFRVRDPIAHVASKNATNSAF